MLNDRRCFLFSLKRNRKDANPGFEFFKNGDDFKLREIDYSSKKEIKKLLKIRKIQESILESKNTDWQKLDEFFIQV